MEHSGANGGCRHKVGVIRYLKGTSWGRYRKKIHGGMELKINSKGERRGTGREGTSHSRGDCPSRSPGVWGEPWARWVQLFALTVIWGEVGKAGKGRQGGSWGKEHREGVWRSLTKWWLARLV